MIKSFPDFEKLDVIHKIELISIAKKIGHYSDYNFTSLWSYDIERDAQISDLFGNLVIKFRDYTTREWLISFIGNNNVNETIKILLAHTKSLGIVPKLKLIPEMNLANVPSAYLDFKIEEDRDNFDYIYSTEEIANLIGPNYRSQRNKYKKFIKDHPDAAFENINLNNKITQQKIIQVFEIWQSKKKFSDDIQDHEINALKKILTFSSTFNLISQGIFVNKQMVAFVIAEVNSEGFAFLHFVKADTDYTGIFEFIYINVAKLLFNSGYFFLNREQDLGLEGLRKAKLGWAPTKFLKKLSVTEKD